MTVRTIWDAFCHTQGRVIDNHNGDVACDHYHLYEKDVKLMQDMGLKYYRFSIAWSRIQPTGRGPANEEGVGFYNRLIDCLLAHGITPMVTLYHWDLPLALQIEDNGWLGRSIVERFVEYANICYERFGDRVKWWITFNEPWCSCLLGHGNGEHAPGIRSDDASKVYLAGHHTLLAHAWAVQHYREKWQTQQGGKIGITLNANWSEPKASDDPEAQAANEQAAERCLLWNLGWFADPVYRGDYPEVMKQRCKGRLPEFTEDEKRLLKGSSEFFGLNHYSSEFVEEDPNGLFVSHWGTVNSGGFWGDCAIRGSGDPTWARTDMGWAIVPWGLTKLLRWIHDRYQPEGGIIITENGCAVDEPTREQAESDTLRVDYLRDYIQAVHQAIQEGADVRGYFAWSFMDNFEWACGYHKRFGLHYVDYNTLERTPKASAKWFSQVLQNNGF